MSNAVFPDLPGLTWNVGRRPQFKTNAHRAVSGRELRFTHQNYPITQYSLSYEFLRNTTAYPELKTLDALFRQMHGSWDSFLYSDPEDRAVVDELFGTGNGSATQYQLTRAYGAGGFSFAEPVQNVNALSAIKVAGIVKTPGVDFTLSTTGLVTFTSAPANSAALTWSGTYYHRCRFLRDELDFNGFLKDLWEAKKVEFLGAVGNKL